MLEECPISCLIVPRMEAVLEDGRLDVVALLAFIEGDGFDLASDLGLLYLFASEVSPDIPAILAGDLDFPFVLLYGDGVDDLAYLFVSHFKRMLISLINESLNTYYFTCYNYDDA